MTDTDDNLPVVVTDDGSCTLQSKRCSETYHSTFGAVSESMEVFLANSGVMARLQSGQPTKVLEIGFGTGLNFALTAVAALEHNCALYYEAIEYDLPPLAVISFILRQNIPQQPMLLDALDLYLQKRLSAEQTLSLPLNRNIKLNLRLEDALQASFEEHTFDAIYLDAFSSKNNPDLWTAPFLCTLQKALKPDGILATYSVNRTFKDALHEAGYHWKKLKGPPGKREVIIAFPNYA